MSTIKEVELYPVQMPSLDSVEFAENLGGVFDNIGKNLSLFSTTDLWKGDKGDSVNIVKKDLNEDPELFELLKSTIKGGLDPQPIGGVRWNELLSPYLYVINKTEIENGVERYVPISSLYYTFVDGRFVNDNVGNLSAEDFADESDLSCILVYEDGEFKKLSNIFPNMYFEDGLGLCWMVNGQRTGLPVQGVPGKDGRNSDILIVKTEKVEEGMGEIEQIWNKLEGWTNISDKESMDGYSCFVLAPTEDGSSSFYLGKLTYDDGTLRVLCNPELSLQQTFNAQTFINVMKNISIRNNKPVTPPGLFVPMKALGELEPNEDQPVHLMTATSIHNEMGDNKEWMMDMVVTPVNTTALTIDADHDVKVDKYLYVRMSDEVRPLVEVKMNVGEGTFTNRKLKFKLRNIIFDGIAIDIPGVDDDYDKKVYFQTEDSIAEDGSLIVDNLVRYDEFDDKKLSMMPADFRENIDKGIGIYVWSLDLSEDSFDPEHTIHTTNTTDTTLNDTFPVVYTKTMTPGIGDDILWLNGLIVDEEDLYREFEDEFNELSPIDPSSIYKLLRGTDRRSLIFDKFIPIYVNSYRMDRDTSYNLNYNVNITGDETNPKRTLSVYGDINCENINVYELTATGEIKNIYTKDTIVSDSGIDLRDVDVNGKVVNKTSVTPYEVNTTEVCADEVNADTVSSNQLKVTSTNVDIMSTDGKSSAITVSGYEYHTGDNIYIDSDYSDKYDEFVDKIKNDTSVDVNNVRRINIRRGDNFSHVSDYNSYDEVNVSVCKTDLPVVFENDAAIIVSNNRPIEDIAFHGHYSWFRHSEGTQFEKTVSNDAACSHNSSVSQELDYIQNHYVSSYSNSNGIKDDYSRTSPFIMFSGTGLEKSRDCTTVLHNNSTIGKLNLDTEKLNRLLNSAVCYYTIDKFDGRKINKFDIKFSKKYELVIDTGSKCSYSNWPHLQTDSYIEFDVLAEIDGNIYRLAQRGKKTYKFDYIGAWDGYEHKEGDYKTRVRSYVFSFNPYDIEILFSDTDNKQVFNLSDSAMTIYVVPTGRIHFESKKKTINYIACTLPRPSSSSKGTVSTTISRNVNSNPKNFYTRSTPSKSTVLNTTLTLMTDGVSSFTICGDGFSVLSGSKAFGFGYGSLFNHFAKNDGKWGTYKDDLYLFCHEATNSAPGCYDENMKAIPFSVLWEMAMNYRK